MVPRHATFLKPNRFPHAIFFKKDMLVLPWSTVVCNSSEASCRNSVMYDSIGDSIKASERPPLCSKGARPSLQAAFKRAGASILSSPSTCSIPPTVCTWSLKVPQKCTSHCFIGSCRHAPCSKVKGQGSSRHGRPPSVFSGRFGNKTRRPAREKEFPYEIIRVFQELPRPFQRMGRT